MNKKASFDLSISFIIKLILGLVTIMIITSFYANIIPFLSKQTFFGKLMLLMIIFVIYDNITLLLFRINK